MAESILSFRFEPISPLFFGTRQELSPYEYVKSYVLPSIYTIAGASLKLIAETWGKTYSEIENLVRDRQIEIRGPYLVAYFNHEPRYFLPSPLNRLFQKHLEIDEDILKTEQSGANIGYIRIDEIPTARLIGNKVMSIEGQGLVEIVFREDESSWIIDLNSPAILEVKLSDRIGFEMERKTRVVCQGTLYSKHVVEAYSLNSAKYGQTRKIFFGCDIKLPEEAYQKITSQPGQVIRLGGEGGLAKVTVEVHEIPLHRTFKIKEILARDKILLAVSHIALEKRDGKPYAVNLGEIEWLIGKIEFIGGWAYGSNTFKKHLSALTPGSILKIKNYEEEQENKEWYMRLLSTIIPIPRDQLKIRR